MPRAHRYIQPGCLYHITHRCHNRCFLFRFGVIRTAYQIRLRLALPQYCISLLAYCITSNHTHFLIEAVTPSAVSAMFQRLDGDFAAWFNARQRRTGAFWGDRYHCTMVDKGEYAWNCMLYIDMNMVRAGAVHHPSEWRWCGFKELAGRKQRYRLLDMEAVRKSQFGVDLQIFRSRYELAVIDALKKSDMARNPMWTDSVAIGSEAFCRSLAGRLRKRSHHPYEEIENGTWAVREMLSAYGRFYTLKWPA